MLKNLLKDNIIIKDKIESWEEAVQIVAQPLLLKQYIKQEYVEAILENIARLGFYIVISENIAIPHATPQAKWVERICISLLKTHQGIIFGNNAQVKLVFLFAAIGNYILD